MNAVVKLILGMVIFALAYSGGLDGAEALEPHTSVQIRGANGIDSPSPSDPDMTENNFFGFKYSVGGPSWFRNSVGLAVLSLGLWSFFWISRDAERRKKSSLGAVVFAMLAGWPLSLLWWLWLRPPLSPPPLPREDAVAS